MRTLVVDVAIVGYGGAGASAAIAAHDAGASVIVLEKMRDGGGSTRISSGTLRAIADVEKATSHFVQLTAGLTPPSMMRVYTDGAVELPGFLESLGGTLQPYHVATQRLFPKINVTTGFPGYTDAEGVGVRLRIIPNGPQGGGEALWHLLHGAVEQRGIRILYDCAGRKLIRDGAEVVGVLAEGAEGAIAVKAKRAVILTCGGFNYAPELQRQFFGAEVQSLSPPGRATGDGIKMAQEVGADLWHMNVTAAGFGFKVPGHEAAFFAHIYTNGFFIVDQKGRRYMSEPDLDSHFGGVVTLVMDPVDGRYYRNPSYLIFNEKTRLARPIATSVGAHAAGHQMHIPDDQRSGWSKDNSEEVRTGLIKVGSTIGELAGRLGIPADRLEATTQRYNQACRLGDDEFERSPDKMEAIDRPPYYGIALWPALLNTQGGPRRNERAQVIGIDGSPIRRLYAAGELGSIWGALYPGAGNVSEAMIFGRIAGANAAHEPPSDRVS
jgi:succinate dehydrogenase/fumarate reductase flavoprotein subunit